MVYWSGGCWFRTSYYGYIVQMLPQSVDVKFGPHSRDTHTHTHYSHYSKIRDDVQKHYHLYTQSTHIHASMSVGLTTARHSDACTAAPVDPLCLVSGASLTQHVDPANKTKP